MPDPGLGGHPHPDPHQRRRIGPLFPLHPLEHQAMHSRGCHRQWFGSRGLGGPPLDAQGRRLGVETPRPLRPLPERLPDRPEISRERLHAQQAVLIGLRKRVADHAIPGLTQHLGTPLPQGPLAPQFQLRCLRRTAGGPLLQQGPDPRHHPPHRFRCQISAIGQQRQDGGPQLQQLPLRLGPDLSPRRLQLLEERRHTLSQRLLAGSLRGDLKSTCRAWMLGSFLANGTVCVLARWQLTRDGDPASRVPATRP